ncbi:MAG: SurA N-terminal domain-containing protein [Rhizobiales bacterium]|nr:SurA N-terminal domain-containing protein [Hyphomicrobiales bacterium]
MLDSMRRAAKGWVAKVLIGILALSFGVFWGIQDVFRGYSSDVLASVGDQQVTAQQFTRQFQDTLRNYSRQTGQSITPDIARQIGLDRQVLMDLIRGAALDAETAKLKLAVSDEQLAGIIAQDPMFKGLDGKFSPEVFRSILRNNNLTEAEYLAGERIRFLRTAISDSAGENLSVPAALVEAAYRFRMDERDARFFVVTASETEVVAPADDELKKYYDDNPQTYTAPEYRSVVVMKADPADIAPKIIVSDEQLQSNYDRYRSDFTTPETRVIEQIVFPDIDAARKARDRIAAGEDFLAIAKELGFDEAGISLGERRKEDIPDDLLAEAAFALPANTVSDPVQGRLSVVLLRVTKITPAVEKTLDEVKGELTSRIQLEQARNQILDLYNSVEDARAAQTPFEEIAEKAGIPIVALGSVDETGLDKDGKSVELPFKDQVLQALFASDVGVENDALQEGDAYVWYEVREVTPSVLRPFEDVKDKVRADLLARKVRELASEKAQKLAERGDAGTPIETLASEAAAQVQNVSGIRRGQAADGFDLAAVTALFSVPDSGFASAVQPDGRSAKVMQALPVLGLTFDPASPEGKTIGDSLAKGASGDLTAMFMTALQDEFGWSIDEALWRRITGSTP